MKRTVESAARAKRASGEEDSLDSRESSALVRKRTVGEAAVWRVEVREMMRGEEGGEGGCKSWDWDAWTAGGVRRRRGRRRLMRRKCARCVTAKCLSMPSSERSNCCRPTPAAHMSCESDYEQGER